MRFCFLSFFGQVFSDLAPSITCAYLAASSAPRTSQANVDRMRTLLSALAVDPHAAVSSRTGFAFFADRAAVLAGAIAGKITASDAAGCAGDGLQSTATEGLGLMLRVLQVCYTENYKDVVIYWFLGCHKYLDS